MKKLIVASIILALFALGAAVARANSSAASDNASGSAYSSSWSNGSNGGSGWGGGWQLTSGGSGGFFIGDSTSNAGGHSGGINTSGSKAWGIYANSGGLADAVRPFPGAMLSNQTFTIAMDNGWINSGGPSVGFGLQDSNGTNRFEFYFSGGDSQYRIADNSGGAVATGIGWTAVGLQISFTLTGSNSYSVSVSVVGSGTTNTFTGTLAGVSSSGITQAYLWNYNAGSGSQYDAFFNSIGLVCNNAAPSISAQPTNQTVCVGDAATLSVTASGTGIGYLWRKGGNGWGGLAPWTFNNTSGDTNQDGEFLGPSGNIDSPNDVSWELYANSNQTADAVRPFNGGMPVGQVFMIDMANSLVGTNGTVGFGLQDSLGTNRFEFYFAGGQTNYFINDGNNGTRGGAMVTAAGYVPGGLHLEFSLTATDSYSFSIVYQDGLTISTNGPLEGFSGSAISQVRLFNVNAGPGSSYNLYFNNLSVEGKSDNAGDGVYNDGWLAGDGGSWELNPATSGSSNGFFIGTSTQTGLGGDIDSAGGNAWGLYANGSTLSEAIRRFNSPLQVGQTFAINMENGDVTSGASVGLGLRDSNNTNRFEFFFYGGNSDYSINDAGGTSDTGIGWTPLGLNLAFTLTGTNSYSLVVSAAGTNSISGLPKTITGTLEGIAGNLIDRMRFFNYNGGSGTNYDLFFNNVSAGAKSDNASDPAYAGGWTIGTDGGQSLNISNTSFTITNVATTDAGDYDAVVSDSSPNPQLIPQYHYSIRWTGQFQAQYSETYTFTTISDDGVRLWVNDQLLIDNWTDHTATTNTATINLTAGQTYNLRLDYYQDYGDALIHLFWSSTHQSQQIIPFTQPAVWDSIPGVPDPLASALGLTGQNAAAASGTVSMAEQVFQTFNNPLTNDLDGTFSNVVVVTGSETNDALGNWVVDGTDIYDADRRGYVQYQVTVPETNVYRLAVTGRENTADFALLSQFDLQAYVDGEYLGRQTLAASYMTYSNVFFYTPWLNAGTHTVEIYWDNAASLTSLRIQSLALQTLGGPVGANGVYHWVNTRLQNMCGMDITEPTNTYVSPVSIEGRDGFLSMMNISATDPSTSTTTNVTPQHNAGYVLYASDTSIPPHTGERWYANVPLSASTGTVIVASFQNGGLARTNTITWVPVNVLAGGNMTIRQGDSLLLTALPGGTNAAGTISITVDSNNYVSTNGAPVTVHSS